MIENWLDYELKIFEKINSKIHVDLQLANAGHIYTFDFIIGLIRMSCALWAFVKKLIFPSQYFFRASSLNRSTSAESTASHEMTSRGSNQIIFGTSAKITRKQWNRIIGRDQYSIFFNAESSISKTFYVVTTGSRKWRQNSNGILKFKRRWMHSKISAFKSARSWCLVSLIFFSARNFFTPHMRNV